MDSLLKIIEFNDLNQIDFALGTTIRYYKDIIKNPESDEYLIEDAERQLEMFRRIKDNTRDAINDYLKR